MATFEMRFVQCYLVVLAIISVLMTLMILSGVAAIIVIFEQAIPSHNARFLMLISALAAAAYLLHGLLRLIRLRLLRRFADRLDGAYERAAIRTVSDAAATGHGFAIEEPIRDLLQMRKFIVDDGLTGLLDFPWVFLFLGLITVLHPLLGLLSFCFTGLSAGLMIASQSLSRRAPQIDVQAVPYLRALSGEGGRDRALGLANRFADLWLAAREEARESRRSIQRLPDYLRSLSHALGNIHGVAILALAAYLTMQSAVSLGVVIAARILASRIADPVRILISGWPDVVAAWRTWPRLRQLAIPEPYSEHGLSERCQSTGVVITAISGRLPGPRSLPAVSLTLNAGEMAAVIGPTGAGKSVLADVLAGRWPIRTGSMTIDGRDRFTLSDREAWNIMGYLPQDSLFFHGSIAENVSRYASGADNEQVIQALKMAGALEFVSSLPSGTETQMNAIRRAIPAGMRRRIALARAIYGNPHLLIFDNPTAHCDEAAMRYLLEILRQHKAGGGTAIVITNEPSLLLESEKILRLARGKKPVVTTREQAPKDASFAARSP